VRATFISTLELKNDIDLFENQLVKKKDESVPDSCYFFVLQLLDPSKSSR
jgi:hypothetical protein